MQCPKCGHKQSLDGAEGRSECEKCSVVFAKVTLNCPRCGHTARGTEIGIPNHCPECGVDVSRFLAARNSGAAPQPAVSPREASSEMASPQQGTNTTFCPACSGVVAYGAKQCPHCGKARPAPKPKKTVSRVTVIAAIVGTLAIVSLASQAPTGSSSGGLSADFKEQAATLINLNGFLCAEVESALKPSSDKFEVTCRLYRQGSSERGTYLVDSQTGKVTLKR